MSFLNYNTSKLKQFKPMKNLKKLSKENLKFIKGGYSQEHTKFCNSRGLTPCLSGTDDFGCRVSGQCVTF